MEDGASSGEEFGEGADELGRAIFHGGMAAVLEDCDFGVGDVAFEQAHGGGRDHAVVGAPHDQGGEVEFVGAGDAIRGFEQILGEGEHEFEAFGVLDGFEVLIDFGRSHARLAPLEGFVHAHAHAAGAESGQGNGQAFDEIGCPTWDGKAQAGADEGEGVEACAVGGAVGRKVGKNCAQGVADEMNRGGCEAGGRFVGLGETGFLDGIEQ